MLQTTKATGNSCFETEKSRHPAKQKIPITENE